MARCDFNTARGFLHVPCGAVAAESRTVPCDPERGPDSPRLFARHLCAEHAEVMRNEYDKPDWHARYEPINSTRQEDQ